MNPKYVQEQVRSWQAAQPDLIQCQQRNGVWTLRACQSFQRGRLNYQHVSGEELDGLAIEFKPCEGCEHFAPVKLGRRPTERERMELAPRSLDRSERLLKRWRAGAVARRNLQAADPRLLDPMEDMNRARTSSDTRSKVKRLISRNPNAAWRKNMRGRYGGE